MFANFRAGTASRSGWIRWMSLVGLISATLLFFLLSGRQLLTEEGVMAMGLREANITTTLSLVPKPGPDEWNESRHFYDAKPAPWMFVMMALDDHQFPTVDGPRKFTTEWLVSLVFAFLLGVPSLIFFILSLFALPPRTESRAQRCDVIFCSLVGLVAGLGVMIAMHVASHKKWALTEQFQKPAVVLLFLLLGVFVGLAFPKSPSPVDNARELEFQTFHRGRGEDVENQPGANTRRHEEVAV